MYSMRYGTVPIVRRIGGLADTVTDVTTTSRANRSATGFVFEDYTPEALVQAVTRALTAFRDRGLWTQLMQTGMQRDFSWERSAREYVKVYERALTKRTQRVAQGV
jgi:starch synthase